MLFGTVISLLGFKEEKRRKESRSGASVFESFSLGPSRPKQQRRKQKKKRCRLNRPCCCFGIAVANRGWEREGSQNPKWGLIVRQGEKKKKKLPFLPNLHVSFLLT